jgi:hypothetical protein
LARLEDMRIPITPQPLRMVGLCQQTGIKCQNGAQPIVISGRAARSSVSIPRYQASEYPT